MRSLTTNNPSKAAMLKGLLVKLVSNKKIEKDISTNALLTSNNKGLQKLIYSFIKTTFSTTQILGNHVMVEHYPKNADYSGYNNLSFRQVMPLQYASEHVVERLKVLMDLYCNSEYYWHKRIVKLIDDVVKEIQQVIADIVFLRSHDKAYKKILADILHIKASMLSNYKQMEARQCNSQKFGAELGVPYSIPDSSSTIPLKEFVVTLIPKGDVLLYALLANNDDELQFEQTIKIIISKTNLNN